MAKQRYSWIIFNLHVVYAPDGHRAGGQGAAGRLKSHDDPDERFKSAWSRHYKRMSADPI
jgi:hypothetical protein